MLYFLLINDGNNNINDDFFYLETLRGTYSSSKKQVEQQIRIKMYNYEEKNQIPYA